MVALLKNGGYERAIAFCNTKNMTDRLAALLQMRGFTCAPIHGDIPQKNREKTLKDFRAGKMQILVATDVAARGLDIDDVDAVFNYDVPDVYKRQPKYNLLYEAFGWEIPTYVHCASVMIDAKEVDPATGEEKEIVRKMSKRHGDPSYEDLVKMGYLSSADVYKRQPP